MSTVSEKRPASQEIQKAIDEGYRLTNIEKKLIVMDETLKKYPRPSRKKAE